MSDKINVTVGDVKIGPKERQYVNEVLDSGRLSYGPFSKKFEDLWAAKHGCKYAVFCNSGTSALHIALAALKDMHGWQDGDEVLVPSVTFVATANVCLHNNLKPVFVDVCPYTYNIDHEKIDNKITSRTRAIIPVHLTGLPAFMPEISRVAREHNLKVIEDSCETTFASVGGKSVGAWGDVGCFSTYMAHYIVTGVGGLATTNDPDLAVRLRSLMNHGRDSIYLNIDADDGLTGKAKEEVIARRFKFEHLGHSFRCTEMEAALGLAQLEDSDAIVARRKAVARRYSHGLNLLCGEGLIHLPMQSSSRYTITDNHVFMIYPLVLPKTDKRGKTDLVHHLESNGIETRDLLPLLSQPVYQKMWGNLIDDYPVAKWLDTHGFYIGCHQHISDEAADHVINTIKTYFNR